MSNSDEIVKNNNYSDQSFEIKMNDSSDTLSSEEINSLSIDKKSYDLESNELKNLYHDENLNDFDLNENSFSKDLNSQSDSSKNEISKSDDYFQYGENLESEYIENSNIKDQQYDNLILTMKVRLDKKNMNEIIVPDNVSIDKLLKISRNNYLKEIDNLKKKEIDNLKKEIHEINTNKFDNIFKNLIESYNSDIDKKIDEIYKKDLNNFVDNNKNLSYVSENLSESKSIKDKLDSDPFIIDHQIFDIKNSLDSQDKLNVNKKSRIPKSNQFCDYFDCVYIINLPNERYKIKSLKDIFNNNKIRYKIIDGIFAKTDIKYMKYYQRWLYQRNLDNKFMNKFIFDEKLYLKKNPELRGLNNKSKCWNHWNKEGRNSNIVLYEKTNILLDSQLGNLIAHINAIRDAKYENYNNVLILEDDVFIHNNFNQLHIDLINKLNNNFNLLFYGGIQKKWNEINIENSYYKAKNTYGGFAYAIKSNIFEILLERMNELIDPVDKLLIGLQNILKSCYVSYPNIFITDLENGKIHRKRDMKKYSEHFKWKLENYIM